MPGRLSPLYHRITRHASLATIFRQPVDGSAPSFDYQMDLNSQPVDRPVKAHLLPAESRLPEAILLPKLPVPTGRDPFAEEAATTINPPISQAAPDTLQTASERVEPASAVAPAPQTEAPFADRVSGPQDEDRNWRRLQTIFRRHQERQQADTTRADSLEVPESSEEDQTARTPTSTAPGLQAQNLQANTRQDARRQGPVQESSRDIHQLNEKIRQTDNVPATQADQSIQRQSEVGSTPITTRAEIDSEKPDLSDTHTSSTLEDESQPGQPPQKLPLEAVWPVQRSPQAQSHASTPGTTRTTQQDTLRDSPVPEEPPEMLHRSAGAAPETTSSAETGQQDRSLAHLQQVQPKQASKSKIEIIPPRRPHPLREADSQMDSTGQVPDDSPEPMDQTAAPEDSLATQIPTNNEPYQTRIPAPEARPEQGQQDQPRQIPTEIGSLPEDLWHLLGEEPPPAEEDTVPLDQPKRTETAPTRTESPGQRAEEIPIQPASAEEPPVTRQLAGNQQSTSSREAPVQRAIAAAESHPEPENPADSAPARAPGTSPHTKDIFPPIQRLLEGRAAPQSGLSSASVPQSKADSSQVDESDVDLDELARQVYGQLRRRLEIDAERLHRRS